MGYKAYRWAVRCFYALIALLVALVILLALMIHRIMITDHIIKVIQLSL